MAIIYESDYFVVEAPEKPHVDRNDGGHIKISPKTRVSRRQNLTPKAAIELMRLTIVVGEAMETAMNRRGVDIGRINYQDNGNWTVFDPDGSYFHVHLYGRARSAVVHKYGQACYFPHREEHPEFYAKFKPLDEDDITEIKNVIAELFSEKRYSNKAWGL